MPSSTSCSARTHGGTPCTFPAAQMYNGKLWCNKHIHVVRQPARTIMKCQAILKDNTTCIYKGKNTIDGKILCGTHYNKILSDRAKASTKPAHTWVDPSKPFDWEEYTFGKDAKRMPPTNEAYHFFETRRTCQSEKKYFFTGGFSAFNPFTNQSTNGSHSSDKQFKFFDKKTTFSSSTRQTINYPQNASVSERDVIDQINRYLQTSFMSPTERKLRGRALLKLVHPDKCQSVRLDAHSLTQVVLKHMKST